MKIIAHLDMDAFFASIEERDNPAYKGFPIAVGADPYEGRGRGVVSTANYEARKYGIHSALPITKAWQISEQAVLEGKKEVIFFIPDFEKYKKASNQVFEIIKKYSKEVEPASIDEFYFNLSEAKNFKKAESICKKIKENIKKEVRVTCSVGIGQNRLIAKISAGIKKPDGLVVVLPQDSEKFLEPLPIRELPGIGPKAEQALAKEGIKTIKNLKKLTEDQLKDLFGKRGQDMFLKARAIDDSDIVTDREVKSIGEQATFFNDSLDVKYVTEEFEKLCQGVYKSFSESGFKTFRTIIITVRFTGFETKTFSKTLEKPESSQKKFQIEALKLLLPFFDRRKNPKQKLIRLVGVRIEKLK